MKVLEEVMDPGTTVEMTIEVRGLLFSGAVFVLLAWLAFEVGGPPRWLATIVMTAIVVSLLRGARWSPFFAGPYLTLSPTELRGRGGLLHGLFVYRRGAEAWRAPYMQGGVGGPRLVAALSARLDAYLRWQTGRVQAELDDRSAGDLPR